MSWSITLIRIAGTEVRIHLTFLLLLAWFGIAGYQIAGWQGAVESILLIVAVFACVVLHEFGHAITARRYGIATPDITLLPIGGLARLSRIPEKPSEEFTIAIAGPLVNLVIAGILLLFGAELSLDPDRITSYGQAFISQLAVINLYLFGFNLIPAFPMDGGRILRASLAGRMGRVRATEISARIGQGLAFVFVLLGLIWGNVLLIFVAVFVYLAAASEAGMSGLMEVAARVPLSRATIRTFERLSPQSTIRDAADAVLGTTQHEFPVVDGGGRMRGVVTRSAIVATLKGRGPDTPVLEAMTEVPTVPEGTRLATVVRKIAEEGVPIVGVVDGEGVLVGYVSNENLSELLMLRDGLGPAQGARGPWQRAGRIDR
jgi:stage IV sporulation protein FB